MAAGHPSTPPPLPPLLGAALWPPLSASWTCPPFPPEQAGAPCLTDFSHDSNWGIWIQR